MDICKKKNSRSKFKTILKLITCLQNDTGAWCLGGRHRQLLTLWSPTNSKPFKFFSWRKLFLPPPLGFWINVTCEKVSKHQPSPFLHTPLASFECVPLIEMSAHLSHPRSSPVPACKHSSFSSLTSAPHPPLAMSYL